MEGTNDKMGDGISLSLIVRSLLAWLHLTN